MCGYIPHGSTGCRVKQEEGLLLEFFGCGSFGPSFSITHFYFSFFFSPLFLFHSSLSLISRDCHTSNSSIVFGNRRSDLYHRQRRHQPTGQISNARYARIAGTPFPFSFSTSFSKLYKVISISIINS